MTRLRMKVGSYETDLTLEEFQSKVEAFLQSLGTISDVEGRGLLVTPIRYQGRPGVISAQILELLIARPGLSEAKIGRRLVDLDAKQIKNALRRLVRIKDIQGTPNTQGRYRYFTYTVTPEGERKYREMVEAEENAKPNAVKLWRALRAGGYTRGSVVDFEPLGKQLGLSTRAVSMSRALLIQSGKIIAEYNVDGESGIHRYTIA